MPKPRGNPNIRNIGFGSRPKEVDDEYRSRIKGVPKKRRWTKERCLDELDEILTHFKKILRDDEKLNINNSKKLKQETVRDLMTMMNRILDFMKYLYPPVQQNLNLNIEMTSDAVIERLKNWKKEEVIVIDGKKDNKEKEKQSE